MCIVKDLIQLIDAALLERGWSARQASIEATGSAHLIARMRRAQEPGVGRTRSLCEVLGLEFYIGPPRTVGRVDLDVGRLALALKAVAAGFPDIERIPMHDRAQLITAVYGNIDDRDAEASAERVRELVAIARRFGVADVVRD